MNTKNPLQDNTQEASQPSEASRSSRPLVSRRSLLTAATATGLLAGFPHIWVPKAARAATPGTGTIKHLLYIRLSGGFRFPCAFNGDVGDEYNPFGLAGGVPDGVQWGVSSLLSRAPFADATMANGLRPLSELADKITVMPAVDHEPLAGGADGNHDTGLERYLTGYVNGDAGFFTRIQMGLAAKYAQALTDQQLLLPAFVMGSPAMARGLGAYAPHRPPVLSGAGFDRFSSSGEVIPDWVKDLSAKTDSTHRDRLHPALRDRVDAYIQTRAATEQYSEIFQSEMLKVNERSTEVYDGVSNDDLRALFGDSGSAQDIRLALRLFHYGCPAVYLDQGGYDYHSGEENNLPMAMEEPNRLLSALINVLPRMEHPEGGTYWDHTVIVMGSEFSRTARGSRFNSARGSDHNSDNSTRWMSMPFLGGPVRGGRLVGASTRKGDLAAEGTVYSYRSVLNTLMDGLGCDESGMFPADDLVPDLLGDA